MEAKEKYHLVTWALSTILDGKDDDGYLSEALDELLLRAKLACPEETEPSVESTTSIKDHISGLAPGGTYLGMKKLDLIRLMTGIK